MGRESGYVFSADPSDGSKKKGAGSWNWILMQSSGQDIILEVDKYAIMHRVKIHARDLRILDPVLSYPSTILGRERAIVLNLEHIKAIITAEEVLLRDPSDDNIAPVVEELRRRLKPVNDKQEDNEDGKDLAVQPDAETGEEDDSPFEFRALEISSRNLDRVRKLKSQMTRLTARVQKVRDELEQLLDDDDDMADLYLSRKLAGTSSPVSGSAAASWFLASPTIGSKISRATRASIATIRGDDNDVEDLGMLLEYNVRMKYQIDGTLNKLTTLREYVDNTEDYINIQLDNHRNQLIQLELILSSGTVCMSIFALVTGIFGVNIPYTWNNGHGYMFKWVIIVTGTCCAILFLLIVFYARLKGLIGS
ncbi:unnamed protein product [Fraxinus pennsylvanica]|uniref:Magnesium transporter n=1 Tax=Fraxinus pennsylvanica TaxID=56036 RepID=A0AAD1ZUL4_9LAMI|nr:unnamed protein product [Fraxinus pennsylvanica]